MKDFDYFLKIQNILCMAVIFTVSFFYLDRWVAAFFHEHFPVYLNHVAFLGSGWLYIVAFALMSSFFWFIYPNKKWRNRFAGLCISVFIPYVICGVLKVLLGRARPELWFSDHLFGFFGFHMHDLYWSFPSGHTTTLMSVAMGIGVIFPRALYYLIALALVCALSRVMLTFHYLSDVLGSAYLVGIEFALMMKGWKKLRKGYT